MRHDHLVAETWTSQQCAAAWGVKTPTWLGYVSRGQAPVPLPGEPKRWDPDAVRTFPRPGAGRSRAAASPEVVTLLTEMEDVTAQIDALEARQRELARSGKAAGAEVRAMARALAVSPQTVYGWLAQRAPAPRPDQRHFRPTGSDESAVRPVPGPRAADAGAGETTDP
jgi:hypothetical protein